MAATYQYQRLAHDAIRILTLHPGKQGDQLVGTLETLPIEFATGYYALSYVWADPGSLNNANEILIRDGNDESLLTLRGGSIVAALHQLRLTDRPRRIWTDQCCINQNDAVERSMQVQYMNRIYRNAAHILVWLGLDEKKEAELAFRLVRELDKVLSISSIQNGSSDPEKREPVSYITDNHKALQALTNRPWFKRGWIVQEIGTKTPSTMHWGDCTLDWDQLASVCERLKGYHHLRSALGMNTSDISFLYRRFIEPDESTHHANRFNFVYELQRSRHLQFSDDRDRVFAFLGHFSVTSHHSLSCGPLSITADYTKTVEQSYIDVAVSILRQSPSTLSILLASVQDGATSLPSSHALPAGTLESWRSDPRRLPSWVPDWRRSEGIILAEPICPHRAHGGSVAKVELMEKPELVLRVHGMDIDSIATCSRRLSAKDLYEKKTQRQTQPMIERLWREVCQRESFSLDILYRNGQSAFFAFMQTLANGCVQAAGHKSVPYHEVPEMVWLEEAARYIVATLGASDHTISDDVRRAAELVEDDPNSDNWCRWATSAADGRVFARTRTSYYVLGPTAMETGDVVCVLLGSKMPFCLRPLTDGRYLLVGECYVHGLMKGEALSGDGFSEKVFDII